MSLKVHNTLTGRLEEFVPLVPGKVGMYVCGVTVYDRSHVGHARALVVFDTIYRYLKFLGYDVNFVRNLTDVDDKIIRRANERGISAEAVAQANISSFNEDMRVLGCERPNVEPCATSHIAEMIDLIQRLIAKGLAYPVEGDVYFAVDKFADYGKLSKRKLEDMVAGSRIDVDERKQHPMDFAMWKACKPNEPHWDSPWGSGRPGWHIECSAMASKYLGQPFDIHGGGNDLVFPHHENEIAQSEGALDQPLARYWLHNGMVNIGQEKMSKSLGNFMTVQQAADLVGGEALRLFVLSTQYRAPLAFSEEQLLEKKTSLNRLYETMARAADDLAGKSVELDNAAIDSVLDEFRTGMNDDFNSPRGLATIFDSVRALNRHLDAEEWVAAASVRAAILRMGAVLGLVQQDPHTVLERAKRDALEDTALTPAQIEQLIADRAAARKSKDFKRADAIRQELLDKGIVLEDKPDGTIWRAER